MKQINDYTPRYLTALVMALLVVGICIPAVSAETIIDAELSMSVDTSTVVTVDDPRTGGSTAFNLLILPDIQTRAQLTYAGVVIVGNAKPSGMSLDDPNELTYSLAGVSRPCTVYYHYERNYIGTITATKMLVFFDQWDIGMLTGPQTITFSAPLLIGSDYGASAIEKYPGGYFGKYTSSTRCADGAREMTITSYVEFKNHLIVTNDFGGYSITLKRVLFDKYYPSRIALEHDTDTVFYNEGADDFWTVYSSDLINRITVSSSSGYLRSWSLHPADVPPINDPVTVYVQNSQTGALLANADININEYQTDIWYNSTAEWGWTTVDLPTGNYEFYASVDGFTQPYPGRLTVDGRDDNIALLLNPNGTAPAAGNITMQFWVFDENNNGIPYAELSVTGNIGEGAGYTSGIMQTNAQGYATWEAPGNTSYYAYASKPGYVSGENRYSVTTASPVHIAIQIFRGVIPTNPIPTQTGVIPTPTQTTPPIQEDNIIGLSVKGLAKGFGIDYDTALLLFGLMIVFGAGGIVMSSVKGGAMEFIAGSIVGTFVAFALGLIPIWIFIIIAVVFGAYVLRVFIQGGQ